ncbi:putative pentatricopeptide repeat-containing protein At1g69350, mitochondrial [Papaver somniferum]|uniref:putative pentatricopeptide repeat-containing protein At1g69350, mitochondrial n=1 Tax=Papaver somniferum TaxID=3469 RepID=UPI000E702939|nr:putative pentatricopeptide repeat-containing protein At1g69350, mitochondrial [Papaver somniferum]
MYSKVGSLKVAKHVFDQMPNRNQASWDTTVSGFVGAGLRVKGKCRNELIGGSAENEEPQAAVKAYKSMRKDGISVNYVTIVSILGYWSALNDLVKVGARIILMGFGQDDYVKNSLLTMYAKCGDFASSSFIFNEFASKTDVSWNVMIATNANQDLHVANAAMDMYGKCGDMVDVLKILAEPTSRSSWIKVNNKVSTFGMGDKFHPEADQIYEKLADLKQIIRET